MRLGKTTLLHFGSQVVVSGAGFAVTWLIAYFLGEAPLGRYAVAVGLGFFWLTIPAAAIGNAIRKRISEGEDAAGYFGVGILLNTVLAIAVAVVIYGAGELLAPRLTDSSPEFVRILVEFNTELAVFVIGTISYRTIEAGLEGQKRVAWSGGLQALERLGRSIAQVTLVLLSFGVAALILSHALSLAVAAIVGLVSSHVRPSIPTREQITDVLAYARYVWMGSLQTHVFGWMDTIVLSFFVTAGLIGIYEAAWGIASLLGMVSLSIRRTLFPEVSELSESGDYDYIRHILDEGLVFSGLFVIPGLAGAMVIGERVLQFYRPSFGQGETILVILVVAYAADVYASQFLNVINAIDRPDVAYRVNLGFILVNLVLNVVLVWQFGWTGAAVATAVASGLRATIGFRSLSNIMGPPSIPIKEIGLETSAAILMGVVVFVARPYAPHRRAGTLMLVALGAIVYVITLLTISTRVRSKARSLALNAI